MKNACESFRRLHRRDVLRVGGLGLCGVTMVDVLRAQASAAPAAGGQRGNRLICVGRGGGPPHTDMFDMKPDAAAEYRGEFKPVKTKVPGLDVCELMPGLARN